MEGRGETGKYIYPHISSCQTDYVYFFKFIHLFNRQQSTVTQTWTKLYKAGEESGPNNSNRRLVLSARHRRARTPHKRRGGFKRRENLSPKHTAEARSNPYNSFFFYLFIRGLRARKRSSRLPARQPISAIRTAVFWHQCQQHSGSDSWSKSHSLPGVRTLHSTSRWKKK